MTISLTMITVHSGNMSSGKSSALFDQYTRHMIANKKCLFIAHISDKERSKTSPFTHGYLSTKHVKPLYAHTLTSVDVSKYDYVFVDEGQWFPDLVDVVKTWASKKYGKYVYVACLNSDYKQRPLMNVVQLEIYADKVVPHRAVCTSCGSEYASCTIRTIDCDDVVAVGDLSIYKAVCRECVVNECCHEYVTVNSDGVNPSSYE